MHTMLAAGVDLDGRVGIIPILAISPFQRIIAGWKDGVNAKLTGLVLQMRENSKSLNALFLPCQGC
jgi:hypothetical protein